MIWNIERPSNDVNTIRSYVAGSSERHKLEEELAAMRARTVEIPLIIDGKEVRTGNLVEVRRPDDHRTVLARAHVAGAAELKAAVDSALVAHESWARLDWYHRVAVFQKAASLLAGPRRTRNIAAVMLNHSKNPYEAEIDLAELVDFWNFNAYFTRQIYEMQPNQYPGETNRFDWRPLEGFVLAIPPFNFYSIAGNLPTAPAMVGNVALWKPARSVILSNYEIYQVLLEAGLPRGVINFVPFPSKEAPVLLDHTSLAGIHFTGSYDTLVQIWKRVGTNLEKYRNFPRIVGETGGKDFIVMHPSADVRGTTLNLIRGAFEYQGQKCSACSRAYIPESRWPDVERILKEEVPKVPMGRVDQVGNLMGAIIDEPAFSNIQRYLEFARGHPNDYSFVVGGETDASKGWFVRPTVIRTTDPHGKLISEEIFGPVLTVYVYPDGKFEETLHLCDGTSPYALTGAIFARDTAAVALAEATLRYSAGNFYINDKPTGAIVARQPFGGARRSGTNDKAGSVLNMLRWLTPRNIKETAVLPDDWRRPFMG
ncbi:MAG TPA: L-glutamate gamma-semialdehyde dehydrogenase [Thermoplasmata archaeon]|nr:L-glutamate gamma-semialdehyde dehydrogenase [Thermoplasmata archaeon]